MINRERKSKLARQQWEEKKPSRKRLESFKQTHREAQQLKKLAKVYSQSAQYGDMVEEYWE